MMIHCRVIELTESTGVEALGGAEILMTRFVCLLFALALLTCCGCQLPISTVARADEPSTGSKPPEKLNAPHLPNAYRIHDKVISGGLPEGDEAFKELS